jgi:flagellar biogenesis protein FliO
MLRTFFIMIGLGLAAFLTLSDSVHAQYADEETPVVAAPRKGQRPRATEAPVVEPAPRRISKGSNTRAESDASSETKTRSPSSPWAVGGPLVLLLIVVLAGATLWKRHGPGVTPGLPRDAVDVLGRRPLDPRTTLWLVRLGSKILVLGVSPAGVENLSEVSDPVEVDLLAGLCRRPNSGESYVDTFRTLFQRGDESATKPAPARSGKKTASAETTARLPDALPDEAFARRFQRSNAGNAGEEDFRVA